MYACVHVRACVRACVCECACVCMRACVCETGLFGVSTPRTLAMH